VREKEREREREGMAEEEKERDRKLREEYAPKENGVIVEWQHSTQ
jgi:uncharacterized protein YnzC (UPF0291/DUF896 family)